MIIQQTKTFKKGVKKLHPSQKKELDKAVTEIMHCPTSGESKIGDLAGVRVYKFRMNKQLMLLAYTYVDALNTITLLLFEPHENFYRDLKNINSESE